MEKGIVYYIVGSSKTHSVHSSSFIKKLSKKEALKPDNIFCSFSDGLTGMYQHQSKFQIFKMGSMQDAILLDE